MLNRSRPDGEEITVYIKGFLSEGERPEDFGAWSRSHAVLAALESESHPRGRGWGEASAGFHWESSGHRWLPRIQLPVPLVTGATIAMRARRAPFVLNPATLATALAADVALNAVRLGLQYRYAERTAVEDAERLSSSLVTLGQRFNRVRLVAHSLGCRKAIRAVTGLPESERPFEIHLTAPACIESLVSADLNGLARGPDGMTYCYYTRRDLALSWGFRAAHGGSEAMGSVGLESLYERMETHDVSRSFGYFDDVHNGFADKFPNMVFGHVVPADDGDMAGSVASTFSGVQAVLDSQTKWLRDTLQAPPKDPNE